MNYDSLMERYKAWRSKHNYTQTEVADRFGCSRAAIGAWENGRNQPQGDILMRMIETLYPGYSDDVLHKDLSCPECRMLVPGPKQGCTHCCQCGHEFGQLCPGCGAVYEPGDRFCRQCGGALQ